LRELEERDTDWSNEDRRRKEEENRKIKEQLQKDITNA